MTKLQDICNKNGPFVDVWDSGDSVLYTLIIVNNGAVSWVSIDDHHILSCEKKTDGKIVCDAVINPQFIKILWEAVQPGPYHGTIDGRKYKLNAVGSYDYAKEFNIITVDEYFKIQTFGLI